MSFVVEMTGRPLTTLKHTCGDTAETLGDIASWVSQYTSGWVKENVTGCLITTETYGIRFAWGADPTDSAGTAFGHVLAAAQSLKLTNHKQIIDFRFVNHTHGSNAVIHVTPETSSV